MSKQKLKAMSYLVKINPRKYRMEMEIHSRWSTKCVVYKLVERIGLTREKFIDLVMYDFPSENRRY